MVLNEVMSIGSWDLNRETCGMSKEPQAQAQQR